MSTRKERIKAEAAALWRELYREGPPPFEDAGELLELILNRLPTVGYEQLASPHLRRQTLSFPKRAAAGR